MTHDNDEMRPLKQLCEFYASKYGYKPDELERGLEAFGAHLFVQEEAYNVVLDGQLTEEADLSDYILRTHDLGVDVVLEDERNKRIMLIQAAWRKRLGEDKVAAFFDVADRLLSNDFRLRGGPQIQDLLAGFPDQIADGWEVGLRFITNAVIDNNDRLLEIVEAKNRSYEESGRTIVCELYGENQLRRRYEELISAQRGGFIDADLNLLSGRFIELETPFKTLLAVVQAE